MHDPAVCQTHATDTAAFLSFGSALRHEKMTCTIPRDTRCVEHNSDRNQSNHEYAIHPAQLYSNMQHVRTDDRR